MLTTIRCVEHFQGGPTTRNNAWNVEAEPEPWIEINSIDARTYGIVERRLVNVITARSNSTDATSRAARRQPALRRRAVRARASALAWTTASRPTSVSRQGVVAIPWHWGDRGLSTGLACERPVHRRMRTRTP